MQRTRTVPCAHLPLMVYLHTRTRFLDRPQLQTLA